MPCPPRHPQHRTGCPHAGRRPLVRGRCLTRKRAAASLVLAGRQWGLQRHALDLVAEHGIHWEVGGGVDDAWACRDCRLMVCPTVVDAGSYLTALHELGHLLAPGNARRCLLESELQAWEWASLRAHPGMGAEIAAQVSECMEEYLHHAQGDRRHRLPGPDESFWGRLAVLTHPHARSGG